MTSAGAATLAYSANGELISRSTPGIGAINYYYTALSNLRGVDLPDGRKIRYLADGDFSRVAKLVDGAAQRKFLYDENNYPVAELGAANNLVSQFVYGERVRVPDYFVRNGVTCRIVTDHVGSPRLIVDVATGAVVQALTYDAFGWVLADTNPGFQPFGFAGGLYDPDIGLVRFGLRDYDPSLRQWTSRDPIFFYSGSPNLYAYADNDPVNKIDPFGTSTTIFGTPRRPDPADIYDAAVAPGNGDRLQALLNQDHAAVQGALKGSANLAYNSAKIVYGGPPTRIPKRAFDALKDLTKDKLLQEAKKRIR